MRLSRAAAGAPPHDIALPPCRSNTNPNQYVLATRVVAQSLVSMLHLGAFHSCPFFGNFLCTLEVIPWARRRRRAVLCVVGTCWRISSADSGTPDLRRVVGSTQKAGAELAAHPTLQVLCDVRRTTSPHCQQRLHILQDLGHLPTRRRVCQGVRGCQRTGKSSCSVHMLGPLALS